MASDSPIFASISEFTKAVVAICVVFVPVAAVGAVGVPVSAGLASGAFALRCSVRFVTCDSEICMLP